VKKVEFLQDHRCSPDGARVEAFKKGDTCSDMRDSLAEALSGSVKIVKVIGEGLAGESSQAREPAAKKDRGAAPHNK
jgi:hypothetical protein